ncbi:MAG: hypothetical protein H8E12_16925 [Rhodobacteraceae bacterium]|nr:hypothetical protein [Paracoccaceae bacterium]
MKNDKLTKLAAQAIRTLQKENESLTADLELIKKAESLTHSLYSKGNIAAEEVFSTLTTLGEKSLEELEVIEKAIEIQKQGSYSFDFGTLSEDLQDDGSLDPLTRLLLEEY